MSDYGEEIIERLNTNSPLRNEANHMRRIILNTIGEWLQNYDDAELFEQIFLSSATEDYLDLQGITYKVYRKPSETDEDYRRRIVYESISHLTVNYVNEVYDLDIYADVYGFENEVNEFPATLKWTSDNPHINNAEGYFIQIDNVNDNRKTSLTNKMVLGGKLKWVIV